MECKIEIFERQFNRRTGETGVKKSTLPPVPPPVLPPYLL
jgi:hypothetical protein